MSDEGQSSDVTLVELRTICDRLGILIRMQATVVAMLVALAAILVMSDPVLKLIAGVAGFFLTMIIYPQKQKIDLNAVDKRSGRVSD